MSTLVFLRRSECKALLNKPLLFIKSVKDIKRYINVPYFQLFATPYRRGKGVPTSARREKTVSLFCLEGERAFPPFVYN